MLCKLIVHVQRVGKQADKHTNTHTHTQNELTISLHTFIFVTLHKQGICQKVVVFSHTV